MKDSFNVSFVIPSIRKHLLPDLYYSCVAACPNNNWEIIILSPYKIPNELNKKENIRIIKSLACPTACMQRGVLDAKYDYIFFPSDDGLFQPKIVSNILSDLILETSKNTSQDIIGVCKFTEGYPHDSNMDLSTFYKINFHDPFKENNAPDDCLFLGACFIPKQVFIDVGGLDCRFETSPVALNDLSIRLHYYGVKFILFDQVIIKYDHQPGETGDHAPLHNAYFDNDLPLLKKIYKKTFCQKRKVYYSNFIDSPKIWRRRFNERGVPMR